MTRYLPVFPLGTVLLPTQVLPLHVFEERYRALMQDLTEPGAAAELGVVLIERGSEVGGGDTRVDVGTVAHLIETERLPDGRWLAVLAGSHRFRVDGWLADDPYPQAHVVEIADEPWNEADGGCLRDAEEAVRDALQLAGELGEPTVRSAFALSPDPARAAWEVCVIAPIGSLDRQKLLEAEGHAERLRLLSQLAQEAAEVLAFRLGGR